MSDLARVWVLVSAKREETIPLGPIGEPDVKWKQMMEREARVERMEVDFILEKKRLVRCV